MSKRLRTHDFKQFVLTINGLLIGGFGEEGGCEYEWAADIGEDTVGADGEVTFSRNNDERVYVDITVMQTSQGYARLMALMQQQQREPEILPMPFEASNPRTGERFFSEYTVFKSRPEANEQKVSQDRTIRILLPYAKYTAPTLAL